MASQPASFRVLAGFLLFSYGLAAQQFPSSQPPLWRNRPDAATFERIENDHLSAAQKFIERLSAVQGSRNIDNTLRNYDEALREINTASNFANLMQNLHPDEAFRNRATEMTQKTSAAATALSLNREVYKALSSLDVSKADPATRYYVEHTLLEFRLAGVDKNDATRARLQRLNDELTDQQSTFYRNIADDQKSVRVDDIHQLDGLPEDFIARHKPNRDGSITLTTDDPDYRPVMNFAESDGLRKRMLEAWSTRAYPKNYVVLKRMMETRYEIASLLGYDSWADYNAVDKMVGTGAMIDEFIKQIDIAARPMADKEFAMLLAERKGSSQTREIGDYEEPYLSELVRRARYDFDSQSVRPYFPYARVKQGILDTASVLFHVSFRQEPAAAAWAPTVETWDVLEGGKAIGRFYLDMHPRKGKFTGAAMAATLDGIRGRQLPEAALMCNFPTPGASDPGLMEYSEVVTFFHEFGHLMHHILGGQQEWAGIAGITTEADFMEAPSQMLEEWMRSPQVLSLFARHYKTGQPIPPDLVARMDRALAFGRGVWVSRQNAATAVSYDIYKVKPEAVDPDQICNSDLPRYRHMTLLPGTHFCASLSHLASYSSSYYTYLWDRVIAEDFFLKFDAHNLLAGATPMRYRRQVLEPGGSRPANDLVKNFLGRPARVEALIQWMGEEFW